MKACFGKAFVTYRHESPVTLERDKNAQFLGHFGAR